jgi:hypothetical protein
MDGATLAGDVTNAGQITMADRAVFGHNVTMIANGELIATIFNSPIPPGTVKGSLYFQGPNTQLTSNVFGQRFDLSMIEVSRHADLNNVTVNVNGFEFGPIADHGTYGLIHAAGGISGTPTHGTLPSGWILEVKDDRLNVVVPIPPGRG